jgi:hypothetical protein
MAYRLFRLFFCVALTGTIVHAHSAYGQVTEQPYRKAVGYLSFILPLISTDGHTTTTEFTDDTRIGFPIGVNVLYSEHFGFSYEITPTIRIQNGVSRTSNILFDPGLMFRFKHGFTIIPRLAFETSGRFGFTPVVNQVIRRTKAINYFLAVSAPVRFGNDSPASIGGNLQFGFIFN